jgi:hypothetical protein
MQPLEVYYLINSYNLNRLKTKKFNTLPDGFWQHSLMMNNTETYLQDEDDDIVEYWISRTGGYNPAGYNQARFFFNCQTTEYLDRRAFIPDSVQSIVVNPQPTNVEPVIADHLMGSALIPEFMEIIKDEIGADSIYSKAASGVRLYDNYKQRMDINNAFRYFNELWNTIRNGVKTTREIEYDEGGNTTSDETTTVDIDDYKIEAFHSKGYILDGDDYYLSSETIITVTYDFDFAYRKYDNPDSTYPWYEVDLFENVRLYRKSKTQETDFLYDDFVLIVKDQDSVTVQAPEPNEIPSEEVSYFSNTIAYYRASFEMKDLTVADLAGIYGLPY